ncbi:MAG: hypothetical protein GXP42_08865 [Chloroflexi bacterium]|nr:hypothetical protein [Chloroflexota bacterium]
MSALFSLLLFFLCLSGLIILAFGFALLVWLRRLASSITTPAHTRSSADDAIEVDYVLLEQAGGLEIDLDETQRSNIAGAEKKDKAV